MLKKSFAFRIFLLNFALLIIPVILYFSLFFNWEYDAKIQKVLFQLHDVGNSRAALLSEFIHSDFRNLNLLDRYLDLSHHPEIKPSALEEELEKVRVAGGYTAVNYYQKDKKGDFVAIASTDSQIVGESFSFREYVRYAVKYGKSVHLAYGGLPHQWPLLFVTRAVYDAENKEVIGVYVIANNVQDFLEKLIDTRQVSSTARFSILTEDEVVFTSSDDSFERLILRPLSKERLRLIAKEKQFGNYQINDGIIHYKPIEEYPDSYEWEQNGLEKIGVKIPIGDSSLTLLLDEDKNAILEGLYVDIGKLTLFFLLILIIVALLNILVINRLSSPLNHLSDVMDGIGKGDYERRYHEDPLGFEINEIGTHLNLMKDNLIKNMENIKEERLAKEMITKELGIGRKIQLSILPQEMPNVEGVKLFAYTLPAKEVGGDFFDAFFLEENKRLVLTVGDASGKGITACLYSFVLRSILRSFGFRYSNLAHVMKQANNLFCKDTAKTSHFVTIAAISYDPEKRYLEYVSAGHPPTIIIHADGTIEKLSFESVALGVISVDHFEMKGLQLTSKDLLFMYTDGLFEVMEEEKLINWLKEKRDIDFSALQEELVAQISKVSLKDDITFLIMKLI